MITWNSKQSSQVMPLFGPQLHITAATELHKCTTTTRVTVVWILQLPYMVND